MRSISLKLIFVMRIIEYECEKEINEKSFFELVIINLNINLCFLISQMFSQSFKII